MSLDLNLGTSFDTSTAAAADLVPATFVAGALKVVQDSGNLVKLTDVLTPLDRPCSVKITNTRIANVYQTLGKGTIPVGNQSLNTSGQSIFVEMNVVSSKVVGTQTVLVPLTARVEVRLPNDGDVTDETIKVLLMATLANLCNEDLSLRVTEMMRGVLARD